MEPKEGSVPGSETTGDLGTWVPWIFLEGMGFAQQMERVTRGRHPSANLVSDHGVQNDGFEGGAAF